MSKLGFGEAVEMGDQSVQFGAQTGAFDGIGNAVSNSLSLRERVGMRDKANFFRQVVEFRRGAGQAGGAGDDGGEGGIEVFEAWNGKLVDVKNILSVVVTFCRNNPIKNETVLI